MSANLIQFPTESVRQEQERVEEERRLQDLIERYHAEQKERRRQRQLLRDSAPVFYVTVIGRTIFFDKRPNLFQALPAIFNVRVSGYHHPIGWFVADRRYLPVIASDNIKIEGV